MELSLVITTRDRATQLKKCLDHLTMVAASHSWELIVVDNGSTDGTRDVLDNFSQSTTVPVTVLTEPVAGQGRARNTGLAAVRGEIVAFTDDDCYVASDYVDQAIAVFQDPRIGYCGGRVNLYDPSDYPITIKESEVPALFAPRTALEAGTIHGANMIFRTRALKEIGGFDDAFGAGTRFSCDDIDACARASFAGFWGAYAPGPLVFHHHGRKAAAVPKLERSYAIGRGAYLAKFTLRRDSWRIYLKIWYWRLVTSLGRSRDERRERLQELEGAFRYLIYRLSCVLKNGLMLRVGLDRDSKSRNG